MAYIYIFLQKISIFAYHNFIFNIASFIKSSQSQIYFLIAKINVIYSIFLKNNIIIICFLKHQLIILLFNMKINLDIHF